MKSNIPQVVQLVEGATLPVMRNVERVTARGNAYYDAAWADHENIHGEEHPRRYFDPLAAAKG